MSRYKNKTEFFSVYNAICDINSVKPKTLTPTQMSILMVILSNVNKDSKEAFPTQENIRKRVGIASDTTYYKAFKPLLEQGWIIQRKRFNASACYQVVIPDNIYTLLTNTVSTESVESVSTENVESVSTENVELTTNINNKYKQQIFHSYANASEDKDSFSNEKRTTKKEDVADASSIENNPFNNKQIDEEVDEFGFTQSDYEAMFGYR